MASISGIGIGCAALTASLLISTFAAAQTSASTTSVTIDFTNLRNQRGMVRLCLNADAAHFPDCSGDPAAHTLSIPATQTRAIFSNIRPGTYAISLIHDENSNGRMDMRLFIPREGFGFSRNPAIGMGPPRFTSAAFSVGASPVSQPVRVRYMF